MSTTILGSEQIADIHVDLDALKLLSRSLAMTNQALIYAKEGQTLNVLTTNNFPELLQAVIQRLELEGYECEVYYTDIVGYELAMQRYDELDTYTQNISKQQQLRKNATGSKAIELLKGIIASHDDIPETEFIHEILRLSYQSGASDIHFQSEATGVYVRLRKDGMMKMVASFTHASWIKYMMKIKFMAGIKMNIDYLSQDGRFGFKAYSHGEEVHIDVRVSVLPGLRGGSLVLRFLDASGGLLTFEQIGMRDSHIQTLQSYMSRQSGLILVTGPTGSGKTTTVYSIISKLNTSKKKIITIEDPVEYELLGIEQSQIDSEKGYTFEEGLKGILRHDPDIIMVGEIRSLETAEMAINAALTGHLVISTLHTNSAIESIARLVNMGVKPYMLASALNLIVGQRLIRKLADPVPQKLKELDRIYIQKNIDDIQKHHPDLDITMSKSSMVPKDAEVFGEGYEGRVGLLEMLEVDDVITQAIMSGKDAYDIYDMAYSQGYMTIEHDGIIKVLQGVTSLEEMRRGIGK